MRDETLNEPFAVQEIFVDGFSDHVVTNGIMTCAGYRIQPPSRMNPEMQKIVVVRLVMPADAIDDAVNDVRQAQREPCAMKRQSRAAHH